MQNPIYPAGKWLTNQWSLFIPWLRKKRFLKISLYSLGATIALLLITILFVLLFVDPNDYKEEITAILTENTGRTIHIQEDIGYTLYPWLGLDLGQISVGNASGFEEPIFAHIDKAKVRIKLLPLLTQHFEMDTVRLEDIGLNLTRKPDGSTNLDDLLALTGEEKEQDQESIILKKLQINGFDMRDAQIVFDDQLTQSHYTFSEFHLKTSPIVLNEPIEIEWQTNLELSNHFTILKGQLNLATEITALMDIQNYRLEPLQFSLTLQGDSIPDGNQILSIDIDRIELDVNQERFILAGFVAKAMDGTLNLDIQADNFQKTPTLSGHLTLADLNVQPLLKSLGISPFFNEGNTLTSDLLTKVGLETQFDADMAGIHFDDFQFLVNENQLKIPRLYLDITQQNLEVETFSIHAFGIPVEGQLAIKQLFSATPNVEGKVVLPLFNVRETAKRLAQTQLLPPFSLPDEKVLPLKTAALATQFQVQEANTITLKNINLRVDDHQLKTEQLAVDFKQHTLIVEALALETFGMQLAGQIKMTQFLSATPNVDGKIDLAPFNVRETMKRFENMPFLSTVSLPNEKVLPLKTAAFSTQFQVQKANAITLKNIDLRVDDHQLKTEQLAVDLNQQILRSNAIALQAFGMQLAGQFQMTQFLSATPNVDGKMDLAPFNVRETLKRFENMPFLPTISLPDETLFPLNQASFKTNFQIHDTEIQLKNIQLAVDDHQLKSGNIDFDYEKETLETKAFTLSMFGMDLTGHLQAQQLFSDQQLNATLLLTPFNPQQVLTRLGQEPVELPAPFTLTRAMLKTDLMANSKKVTLNDLLTSVDNNQLYNKQLTVNFANDSLIANQWTADVLGATLNGNLSLEQMSTQPNLTATLKLSANPRQILAQLKQSVPETADPKVLTKLVLETQLQGKIPSLSKGESVEISSNLPLSKEENVTAEILSNSPFFTGDSPTLNLKRRIDIPLNAPEGKIDIPVNPFFASGKLPPLKKKNILPPLPKKPNGIALSDALSLNQLKIQLDESHLQGKLQIQSLQPQIIAFNLEVDNIDVDRYLPPKKEQENQSKEKENQPTSLPSGEEALSTLEKLRTLQIDGNLKVDKLKIYSLNINNIDLDVGLKDGKFNVTPNGTFFLPSISFD